MKHQPLDIYDDFPRRMREYLSQNGWHFSKSAYEYAVKQMRKKTAGGEEEAVEIMPKKDLENLMTSYGVKLKEGVTYDALYVACMGVADYLKSSLADDAHLALYVKDTIEDFDGTDELPFRYWCQKQIAIGRPIPWEDIM